MSILAEVFEQQGALDKLEGFTSTHGAAFYCLRQSRAQITLRKGYPIRYPARIETGAGPVTVFDPVFDLHWHVETLTPQPYPPLMFSRISGSKRHLNVAPN